MKKPMALMFASLAIAIAMPHMPESDGKLILNIALGILIGLTIRAISNAPGPRQKPAPWGVMNGGGQ